MIWELAAGSSLAEASEAVGLHYTNAHRWVRRFLASGVTGLADHTRSGRPPAYVAEATSAILKTATARPQDLGLRFTTWSLPKLEEYLRQQPGLKDLARSTIRRRLRAAGLRYRAGQTWCQRPDGFVRLSREGEGLIVIFKNESREDNLKIDVPVFPDGSFHIRSTMTGESLGTFSGQQMRQEIQFHIPADHKAEVLEIRRYSEVKGLHISPQEVRRMPGPIQGNSVIRFQSLTSSSFGRPPGGG